MSFMSAAQVVVMAGGANDFALDAMDLDSWQAPYMDFVNKVSCCSLLTHPASCTCSQRLCV